MAPVLIIGHVLDFSGRLALAVLYRMSFGMDPGTITSDPECLDKHDRLVRAMNTCNTISSGYVVSTLILGPDILEFIIINKK